MLPASFTDAIAKDFPVDFWSTDPADKDTYGYDWTMVFKSRLSGVARPRSTVEVSRFLALCNQARVPVVPSGGRTGLAGGAVAMNGEVVLSLERMNHLGPVDTVGGTVRVGAGAITQAVHEHCAQEGFTWPIDLAPKGSCQIGGNIATNAGGVRVIRYGLVRQWVLGLEAVLADGTVLALDRALEKNNTGPDLRQLFIGSEGILGVVTQAVLKLTRPPAEVSVYLFALESLASVLRFFSEVRTAGVALMAFEFFTDRCLGRLLSHRKGRAPFAKGTSHYVLVELEGAADDVWLDSLFQRRLVEDGVVAQSSTQASELWALREGISESLSATGLPHKNDIALPIAALGPFCAALEELLKERYSGYELCLFGHIGDGNLHVNIMKPEGLARNAFLARTHEVDADLFGLVQRFSGSISAEHGIGLLKKDFLEFSRTPAEIAVMRGLKTMLDPNGILNPGKVF